MRTLAVAALMVMLAGCRSESSEDAKSGEIDVTCAAECYDDCDDEYPTCQSDNDENACFRREACERRCDDRCSSNSASSGTLLLSELTQEPRQCRLDAPPTSTAQSPFTCALKR